MWSEAHVKSLLILSVLRSGSESDVIDYTGAGFMKQVPEKHRELLTYLADISGEMSVKRPINNFKERAEVGLDGIHTNKQQIGGFLDSPVGIQLKQFGAIEWFCEPAFRRGARFVNELRPIFKQERESQVYQDYLHRGNDFIRDKFEEFLKNSLVL